MGWEELVKRARIGEIQERGLFGPGGVLIEVEELLGLNGELFDEVEYRLGLRDVDSEFDHGSVEDNGERKVIDAYSDYMDKWGQGR